MQDVRMIQEETSDSEYDQTKDFPNRIDKYKQRMNIYKEKMQNSECKC